MGRVWERRPATDLYRKTRKTKGHFKMRGTNCKINRIFVNSHENNKFSLVIRKIPVGHRSKIEILRRFRRVFLTFVCRSIKVGQSLERAQLLSHSTVVSKRAPYLNSAKQWL